MNTPEFWSIVASIVSIILGAIAILASLGLFVTSRSARESVSNLLTKIEAQVDILKSFTGKQLDRFTKYVTSQRPTTSNDDLRQIFEMCASFQREPAASFKDVSADNDVADLKREVLQYQATLCSYMAMTNLLTQCYPVSVHDDERLDNIMDSSASDFAALSSTIAKQDLTLIKDTHALKLYRESTDFFAQHVKTAAQYHAAADEQG